MILRSLKIGVTSNLPAGGNATGLCGIVKIMMLLGGFHAVRVRRQAAELLVRHLGGDLALVDEVCRIRGLRKELAIRPCWSTQGHDRPFYTIFYRGGRF